MIWSARFGVVLIIVLPVCIRLYADEPAVRRVQAAWRSSPESDSWISLLASETETSDDELTAVPPLPDLNDDEPPGDADQLLMVPLISDDPLESLSVPLPDQSVARELERRHRERDENYRKLMLQLRALLEQSQQQQREPSSTSPPDTAGPAQDPATSQAPDSPMPAGADPPAETSPTETSSTDDSRTDTPQTKPPQTADSSDTTAQAKSPDESASGGKTTPSVTKPSATTDPSAVTDASPVPDDPAPGTSASAGKPSLPPALLPVPEEKPSSVFADSLSAQAMINEPVDRVGLADNLYALKELQIALEMYQQVDRKALPASEQFWVAYQTASCLRRLGRIPEAQEQYRRLAGQASAGWLARMSRWWLDQIDARIELETGIARQKQIVTALTEVLNASATE